MVSVYDWSTTPASNTAVDGVNIAEGMNPSGVNNAIRAVMAGVASLATGAQSYATIAAAEAATIDSNETMFMVDGIAFVEVDAAASTITTNSGARYWRSAFGVYTPEMWGLVQDGGYSTGSTSGTALTLDLGAQGSTFGTTDTGKTIVIPAAASGGAGAETRTITYGTASTVTLSSAPTTDAVAGQPLGWGTPNDASTMNTFVDANPDKPLTIMLTGYSLWSTGIAVNLGTRAAPVNIEAGNAVMMSGASSVKLVRAYYDNLQQDPDTKGLFSCRFGSLIGFWGENGSERGVQLEDVSFAVIDGGVVEGCHTNIHLFGNNYWVEDCDIRVRNNRGSTSAKPVYLCHMDGGRGKLGGLWILTDLGSSRYRIVSNIPEFISTDVGVLLGCRGGSDDFLIRVDAFTDHYTVEGDVIETASAPPVTYTSGAGCRYGPQTGAHGTITITGTNSVGGSITITSDTATFDSTVADGSHWFRYGGATTGDNGRALITGYTSPTVVTATVEVVFTDTTLAAADLESWIVTRRARASLARNQIDMKHSGPCTYGVRFDGRLYQGVYFLRGAANGHTAAFSLFSSSCDNSDFHYLAEGDNAAFPVFAAANTAVLPNLNDFAPLSARVFAPQTVTDRAVSQLAYGGAIVAATDLERGSAYSGAPSLTINTSTKKLVTSAPVFETSVANTLYIRLEGATEQGTLRIASNSSSTSASYSVVSESYTGAQTSFSAGAWYVTRFAANGARVPLPHAEAFVDDDPSLPGVTIRKRARGKTLSLEVRNLSNTDDSAAAIRALVADESAALASLEVGKSSVGGRWKIGGRFDSAALPTSLLFGAGQNVLTDGSHTLELSPTAGVGLIATKGGFQANNGSFMGPTIANSATVSSSVTTTLVAGGLSTIRANTDWLIKIRDVANVSRAIAFAYTDGSSNWVDPLKVVGNANITFAVQNNAICVSVTSTGAAIAITYAINIIPIGPSA